MMEHTAISSYGTLQVKSDFSLCVLPFIEVQTAV